jgi:ATP-dependent DNA helicase RecG
MDVNQKYTSQLNEQIAKIGKECRYLEFKSNYQEVDKLGRYISALSNGACLDHQDFAYLYFGVDDETLEIKGTTFDCAKVKAVGNEALELYLRRMVVPKVNFSIIEFMYEGKQRVVLFKIPAAVNEPTTYKQKPYIRVDSHVTDLTPYVDWMRQIYTSQIDWSAQIVEDAALEDLDPEAIMIARKGFKERFPQFSADVDNWADSVFLDRANLTQDGMITRTALLLVGKREKAHKLGHIAQIVWKCYQDKETFGDIFTIPFIKATTDVLGCIRNYRFKIYPHNSMIPAEVLKYDTRSILEGMHNCILHQDYVCNERILVIEDNDKLTFENAGGFYEGDYEEYITGQKTPKRYRNPFLAKAMDNVKMVDSKGYGIHNMFLRQKERYLPMPDYKGSDDSRVVMHLPGTVLDEKYSIMLLENSNINLTEAVLLDQVQKGILPNDNAIAMLRKKHLIEGRKPRLFVAKQLAKNTGTKVEYSKHKGLEVKSCESLLLTTLKEHGKLSRTEIDSLLWNVVSDQLDDKQKKSKIGNILTNLRKRKLIENETVGNYSKWSLVREEN